MHKLIARTADNRLVMFSETFESDREAVAEWYSHDNARRAGRRPHVQWYAVREVTDNFYGFARVDMSAFNDQPVNENILTDSEYAEIIGALQQTRDRAEAAGRDPEHVRSALRKLTRGCTPSTNGMTFSLVQAA